MSAIGGKAGCDRDSSDLGELGEFGGIAEVAVVIALCVLAPSPREKFVQFSVQGCPGFGQRLDCLAHSTDPSVTTAPADFLERLDGTSSGSRRRSSPFNSRPAVPRPDPGRQYRPDEGGR